MIVARGLFSAGRVCVPAALRRHDTPWCASLIATEL